MSVEPKGYDIIFKLVLIGDSFTGKTNILGKYLHNEFNSDTKATVGVEFGSKNFSIEGNNVKAQIWDTAGQERYRSITNAYYKGAVGAFLVYDITRKNTFESVDKWVPDLKTNGDKNINILLVGNKSDLENQREVTKEEGQQKAEQYGIAFIETSALNGNNINEAFDIMIHKVYENNHKSFETAAAVEFDNEKGENIELNKNNNKVQNKKCC